MAGRNFLFVPGPTNTPDRILRAMHIAMEDHRSSSFPSLAAPVLEDLKQIFKTTTAQIFIAGSMDFDPCDMGYVHPTHDNALRWARRKSAERTRSGCCSPAGPPACSRRRSTA